ncbi:SMP-30/gluconolactonase/LRE family protein [Salinisphaera hydrothermalis]|uniref:SMP-30/gluconolactonase/LRE family protein n=1 Tax=Salinisphaera hydrothermalis TaxID=563188 RepID=UPI00333EDE36
MRILLLALILVAGFVAYATLWPSRFDPVAWQAPPVHALDRDTRPMSALTRLGIGAGTGPETVAIGPEGRLYAGYADGTIRRFDADKATGRSDGQVFATTNGRPLGLAFGPPLPRAKQHQRPDGTSRADRTVADADNAASGDASPGSQRATLYVADADQGLLAINRKGQITELTSSANGRPFGFTDDVTVAKDGRVYFTDASSRWPHTAYRTAILEHHGDGRLLRYDPKTGRTDVLLDGLQFANGVALGPDDAYVLVTETGAYRVTRYWLTGPHAGAHDVFIDDLPGFPDGIDADTAHRGFWIALFAPRNTVLDFAAPYPWLREVIHRLPSWLKPAPAHVGHIVHVANNGHVISQRIDDSNNAYAPITSVTPAGQWLYLGSLETDAIGRVPAQP